MRRRIRSVESSRAANDSSSALARGMIISSSTQGRIGGRVDFLLGQMTYRCAGCSAASSSVPIRIGLQPDDGSLARIGYPGVACQGSYSWISCAAAHSWQFEAEASVWRGTEEGGCCVAHRFRPSADHPVAEPIAGGEMIPSGIECQRRPRESPKRGWRAVPVWSADPHRGAPAPGPGCHEQNRLALLCRRARSRRLFLPGPH
jgi:hypothetical protein